MTHEDQIRLEARLAAIEYFVQRLYVAQLSAMPDPKGAVAFMQKQWSEGFSKQSFKGVDPVKADLAAAELQQQAERILEGVKEIIDRRAG